MANTTDETLNIPSGDNLVELIKNVKEEVMRDVLKEVLKERFASQYNLFFRGIIEQLKRM